MKSTRRRKSGGFESRQRQKPCKLRIIGGQMRGRTIQYHGADFTRPMKDSVRENVFNILGTAVRGSLCFDLFAGTGAMGFESVSRGATSAVMVEQDRRAAGVIEQTARSLDIEARVRVVTGDTFHVAPTLLGPPQDDTPWLVFVCPPYALWQSSLAGLNGIIRTTLDHAPPGSVLMAETEKGFDVSALPSGNWDVRDYGSTRVAFIEPAMQCGMTL